MDMPGSLTILVNVVSDHNKATVADAATIKTGEVTVATGSAIRHPDDRFNAEVAFDLAVGRALQNLGRKLERRGHGLCKHHDDVRALKKAQAEERNKKNGPKNKKKV